MNFGDYNREDLINQLTTLNSLSDKEIESYNKVHKKSIATRKLEISEALNKLMVIEDNEDLTERAVETCKALDINYNPDKTYGPKSEFANKNSEEYKIISCALKKGIIKKSYDVRRIRERYHANTGKDISEIEILSESLRLLITEVVGLSVEQWYSLYSTSLNRTIHAFDFTKKILELTDTETKKKYNFDNKRTIFGVVFPEFFEEEETKENFYDILFCEGQRKSGYIKNSKTPKVIVDIFANDSEFESLISEINTEKGDSGRVIDKKIYDALNEMFEKNLDLSGIDAKEIILKMLADYKTYFTDSNTKTPGFVEVIASRGCYKDCVDFYYSQLNSEEKMYLLDTYMEIKADQMRKNPGLKIMLDFVKENEQEIFDGIGLDDF